MIYDQRKQQAIEYQSNSSKNKNTSHNQALALRLQTVKEKDKQIQSKNKLVLREVQQVPKNKVTNHQKGSRFLPLRPP